MRKNQSYLMENPKEHLRLERKTRKEAVLAEAMWCGIGTGMRVMDAGCGPGKTTSLLCELIQPGGTILGVDYSEKRIKYAKENYHTGSSINFHVHDLRYPMKNVGIFDAIWTRFVLEYNRMESFEIVKNLSSVLKPGGSLCLIDLDYNCMSHHDLPKNMETVISRIGETLEKRFNFDPFVGRKLYSFLYDLGYDNIQVEMKAHHLFYGKISENDVYNWQRKIDMATSKGKDITDQYPGGSEGFAIDFKRFFLDPRRFTYTPLIMCKGTKPT